MQVISLFQSMSPALTGKKLMKVIGKNCKTWFTQSWASGKYFGDFDNEPRVTWIINDHIYVGYDKPDEIVNDKPGIISLQFQLSRTGGANTNITAEGSGVDVEKIRYGQRCFMIYQINAQIKTGASSWVGMYPTFFATSSEAKRSTITLNCRRPSMQVLSTTMNYNSEDININRLFNYTNWIMLRDNRTPTVGYHAYTPVRPIVHSDGVADTTWTVVNPADTSGASGWFNYNGGAEMKYIMQSAPSDRHGDNILYFWPGGGANKLFMMDQTNVGSNFCQYTLPTQPDGTPYKYGDWTNLGLTCPRANNKISFDPDLKAMAEAHGYGTINNASSLPDADNPFYITGKVYDYDSASRRKELSTLRYLNQTNQLGADVTLGNAPLILHNIEKDGKITIDGGGIRVNIDADAHEPPSGGYTVAFTKNGDTDEVNLGSEVSPNWTVQNTIPFQYKKSTETGWSSVVDTAFISRSTTNYYNFKFDVQKGDDVYMHFVEPTSRDEQCAYVIIENDTFCSLEAEN